MIAAQASLVARWMLVGFVHGVMNTDNMTISGETIDYGPCAFMEAYDPATVFSSIDHWGRYAYGNQPAVALWNLARFAETLLPLFSDDAEQAIALATESLGAFRHAVRRRLVGGHAGQARPAPTTSTRRSRPAGRRAARPAAAEPRRLHVVLPPTLGRAARGDAEPVRGLFIDLAAIRRLAGALARARSGRRT